MAPDAALAAAHDSAQSSWLSGTAEAASMNSVTTQRRRGLCGPSSRRRQRSTALSARTRSSTSCACTVSLNSAVVVDSRQTVSKSGNSPTSSSSSRPGCNCVAIHSSRSRQQRRWATCFGPSPAPETAATSVRIEWRANAAAPLGVGCGPRLVARNMPSTRLFVVLATAPSRAGEAHARSAAACWEYAVLQGSSVSTCPARSGREGPTAARTAASIGQPARFRVIAHRTPRRRWLDA